jgi:hypothetical protein
MSGPASSLPLQAVDLKTSFFQLFCQCFQIKLSVIKDDGSAFCTGIRIIIVYGFMLIKDITYPCFRVASAHTFYVKCYGLHSGNPMQRNQ